MRPRKRFGQHFLEAAWVTKVIDSRFTRPTTTRFSRSDPAAARLPVPWRHARAVSSPWRSIAISPACWSSRQLSNVRVIQADFLDVDLAEALRDEPKPIRVAGNLPYNVSSPILFTLLGAADEGRVFSDATLMLQKEVADRLVAKPGRKEYGVLAIQVALTADVEQLLTLPPGAFRPPPKVTSAVVRLRFRPPAVDVGDPRVFERIVRGIFLQRRKTVANALRSVADALGRAAAELA